MIIANKLELPEKPEVPILEFVGFIKMGNFCLTKNFNFRDEGCDDSMLFSFYKYLDGTFVIENSDGLCV